MRDVDPSRGTGWVALVLHAHLPYVRHPEHERSLEERWQNEALWETYLPLVETLDRLEFEGIRAPLSISVSPPLAAMWADPMLRARSKAHLERTRAVAERALGRLRNTAFFEAIAHHVRLLDAARATLDRIAGDVLGALVRHHRAGRIHLFTTAATHAFLPGLAVSPAWARAQIHLGSKAFEALSGIAPRGLWLPECAFAPWIDPLLSDADVRWTVLDAHGVALAEPRPDVITLGSGEGALVVPPAPIRSPGARGVTYFGRDLWASRSVWAMNGYPADAAYREFHRDLGFDADEADLLGEVGPWGARIATGIKLHRVTGRTDDKAPYDPIAGRTKAIEHARAFVRDRARLFSGLRARDAGAPPPLSIAPFDAELFGHFWHEGVVFVEHVLRALAEAGANGGPRAVTLAEAHAAHARPQIAVPATSTWGEGGFGRTWAGPRTAALWRHVHHAGQVLSGSARSIKNTDLATPPKNSRSTSPRGLDIDAASAPIDLAKRLLGQGIVEGLLLQSSDFAFMIHRGTTAEYATHRTSEHAANAHRLARMVGDVLSGEGLSPDEIRWADRLRERTPFLRELSTDTLVESVTDELSRGR